MSQFPASKYVRYKRATSFFLDWLLRARDHGHDSSKRVRLETLNDVVAKVAAEPSTLTPGLLKDFPKALAACQCAITMREHVAAFFADAEHGHQHFLKLLRSWLNTLKGVVVEPHQDDDGTTSSAELESQDFNNYYEVLEVDEDYFPDEGTYVAEPTAAKNFKVDRQRLLDEAFAEDMRLEVAYFFIELEELAQNVFNVYDQVKKQQRTMVEATVVAKLAMDVAGSLAATLQLRYPSLRTGLDFVDVIMQTDVESLSARMEGAHNATRKSLKNEGVFTFVPGMFMLDFLSVGITLEAFKPIIPPNLRYGIVVPRGYFGESYDEERTPHYVLPDPSFVVLFLMQQLPVLLNSLTYTKVTTFGTYEPTEDPDWRLSGCFMSVMDKYFKSREITVLTVFVCICWLMSVAALQGDGGLCRSTTLTLKHAEDLTAKFDVTVAKGAVQAVDKELHGFYRFYATIIRRSGENTHLAYTNSIVAGLTMLDHHFEYLDLASELIVVTSKLRDFGHVYNALVNEGFLQQLPFVEEVLKIYDRMIFTPSRPAAAHGAYFRTYLLSSALKATALDSTLRGERTNHGSGNMKQRAVFFLEDVSKIYRLMAKDDKSFLRGVSSEALLTKAASICSEELFETRVLSRDMLQLHDDITEVFSEMRNILGVDEGRLVASIIRVLDAVQSNGDVIMSTIPGGNPYPWLGDRLHGGRFKAVCMKFAAAIESKFSSPVCDLERKYCVFHLSSSGGQTMEFAAKRALALQ